MSEWISVKKKKPKLGQEVLIWDESRHEVSLEFFLQHPNGEYIWGFDEMLPTFRFTDEYITHWMPVPEGPK